LVDGRKFATSGVNFINVLRTHFSYEHLFSSYVLALNELSYEKFASLMLMKLTAGVNFINLLCAHFLYKILFKAKQFAEKRLLHVKFVHLTLMKLTTSLNLLTFHDKFFFNMKVLIWSNSVLRFRLEPMHSNNMWHFFDFSLKNNNVFYKTNWFRIVKWVFLMFFRASSCSITQL